MGFVSEMVDLQLLSLPPPCLIGAVWQIRGASVEFG
jgi:hypothetical protein